MALPAGGAVLFKSSGVRVFCRKREKEKDDRDRHPYHVVEITPPPTNLGVRCFPSDTVHFVLRSLGGSMFSTE